MVEAPALKCSSRMPGTRVAVSVRNASPIPWGQNFFASPALDAVRQTSREVLVNQVSTGAQRAESTAPSAAGKMGIVDLTSPPHRW